MPNTVTPFYDEQIRLLINLEQHYDVWIEAERRLAARAIAYGNPLTSQGLRNAALMNSTRQR